MTDEDDRKRDRDNRAAELALGLLSGADKAAAERELLRDPAFRAAHAMWTAKAGQWLEDVPPATDGNDLWPAIEAAIERSEAGVASSGDPVHSGHTAVRQSGRGPVFAWAVAATLFAVVAGVMALHFSQRAMSARQDSASLAQRLAQAEGERQVAQITGDASQVLVSALYDPANGMIAVKLDVAADSDLVPELWVIPGDGKPRSLGTFTSASAQLNVDSAVKPFLVDGATLAVTLEPADGAPHAAPTGAVLGATQLTAI